MSETTQAQASAANEAIQDPAPRMNPAPVTAVSLMRGVKGFEDWETDAVIRELNGEDEEAIASLTNKEGLVYSDYMSALLKRAVVSIGDIQIKDNPSVIDNLIIGDRDLLFVGAMKATYGRFRELDVTCGNCGSTNFVTLNLDEDFKFDRPSKDFTKPLEIEMRDGSIVKINYPTGGDSAYVAKKSKTIAEQNTLMIARCIESDDETSVEEKERWAKTIGVSDRNKLVRALTSNPPGPKMEEVKTQCAKCQEDLIIVMDWVSLLFG
jgi:hypothetical protein